MSSALPYPMNNPLFHPSLSSECRLQCSLPFWMLLPRESPCARFASHGLLIVCDGTRVVMLKNSHAFIHSCGRRLHRGFVGIQLLDSTSVCCVSGPYLELGLRHDPVPGCKAGGYNNDHRLNSNTRGNKSMNDRIRKNLNS